MILEERLKASFLVREFGLIGEGVRREFGGISLKMRLG